MAKIYDYQVNDKLELYLLIKSATEKEARNGKPYIAFVFQDTSGEISANLWDARPDQVQAFQEGRVAYLEGKRTEYKGTPQINISSIRLAKSGEPNRPELFVKRAPMKKEEMVEDLNQAILSITNPSINRIVRYILNTYHKSFFEYPAAKSNHHAFYAGLAYHTVTMLKIAQALADIYPKLDKSLLYGGLILHDLGKTMELSGPTATQYTFEGKLIGHIVLVNDQIARACQDLKIDETLEEVVLLKHMVLSHHGQLDFGSPIRPQLLEAEVLHQIDLIDAKVNMVSSELDKTEPGQFTPKIWAMDNRSFYHPGLAEGSSQSKESWICPSHEKRVII